jgi:hypothetical protein
VTAVRVPPRIATWLLERFGPGYRNDSLVGDLFEEYQRDRTRAWYWKQAIVAICIGQVTSLRKSLPQLAASALLCFLTEAAGFLGVIALSQQIRYACSAGWMVPEFASIAALLAGIGLCVSLGFYVSVCVGSRYRQVPATRRRRNTPIKRLAGVFALTALSAGTLTWAAAAPRVPQQCTLRVSSPQGASQNTRATPSGAGQPMGTEIHGN